MSLYGAPSNTSTSSSGVVTGPQGGTSHGVTAEDNNHNRLLVTTGAPASLLFPLSVGGNSSNRSQAATTCDLDGISLFDDVDFSDKPKEINDCLDDLADLIEEKSVKPMLAAVAPTNMMIPSGVGPGGGPPSGGPSMNQRNLSEAERRRNDAVSLLKSLSVPDPLLGQLVAESMTGFIFVVDAHGTVEFVSDSSTENVGHSPLQIQGNTIYNFLHPADHSRFGCHLVQQQSPPTTSTDPDKARRNFTCRFKLQNHSSGDSYMTLYVACITVRRDQESAETSRLLCVARKLSDVSPHPLTVVATPTASQSSAMAAAAASAASGHGGMIANTTELFTTKLDPTSFKVMHAGVCSDSPGGATRDSGRLRASVAAKTLSMVGKCFLDFCHPEDRDLVRGHFLSTVREKQSVSRVYRMTGLIGNHNGSIHQRLSNVVHVQTKSKYHKALTNNSSSIVSIHSIVGDFGITPQNNRNNSGSSSTSGSGGGNSNSTSSNLSSAAATASAVAVAAAAASVTSTTSYLLNHAETAPPSGGQRIHHQQLPVVMMSSAMPKMSTLSSLLSTPPSSTMTSTSSVSVQPPRGSSGNSTGGSPTRSGSGSSNSPSNENSEEAKNQLLKQLLNSNFQPSSSSTASSSTAESGNGSTSNESSRIMKLLNSDGHHGLGGGLKTNSLGGSGGLKRQANYPLDNAPASKMPCSVVCSENPSLTELLEKPPHLSMTVPPPVPTKWHQEPREKLPKADMRKFLPPHPAERAAKAAAAAAAATASKTTGDTVTTTSALFTMLTSSRQMLTQQLRQPQNQVIGPASTASAASATSASTNPNRNGSSLLVYTSNSGSQSATSTSASTSRNVSVMYEASPPLSEERDDMLSDILDDLIAFQERSPPPASSPATSAGPASTASVVGGGGGGAGASGSTSSGSGVMPQAAKADERRISDIERFLASSERSLFQQRLQPQGQPQQLQLSQAASASAGSAAAQQVQPQPTAQPQNQQRPKISSLAASAPSLTSILSAPPLATPSGRPQPSSVSGNISISGSGSQKTGSGSELQLSNSRNNGGVGNRNPVNLVPRMNELLQQVPPNVSIPDTPDLDSLILLQERRRRISSGGPPGGGPQQGNVKLGGQPQNQQPQASSLPPTGALATLTSQGRSGGPTQQQQTSFNISQQPSAIQVTSSKGQLLMQQLTSGPSRGSNLQPQTMSRSISYIEATPSSGGSLQQQQPQLFVSNNGTPQVLARRSSFSGISPVGSISPVSTSSGLMSSPPPPGPPGAAAAAAAAVAAASAGVLNQQPQPQGQAQGPLVQHTVQQISRTLPQRHASGGGGGGTVHHNPNNLQVPQQLQRPQLQILGSAGNVVGHRRLSGSGLEIGGPLAGSARSEDKQRSLLQQLLSE